MYFIAAKAKKTIGEYKFINGLTTRAKGEEGGGGVRGTIDFLLFSSSTPPTTGRVVQPYRDGHIQNTAMLRKLRD